MPSTYTRYHNAESYPESVGNQPQNNMNGLNNIEKEFISLSFFMLKELKSKLEGRCQAGNTHQ